MPHPALSPAEAADGPDPEASLWSALSTDRAAWAREQIFARHAGFARGLARKLYRQRNMGDLDPADLDQFAYVGLMESMDRYDPAVGTPFRGFSTTVMVALRAPRSMSLT